MIRCCGVGVKPVLTYDRHRVPKPHTFFTQTNTTQRKDLQTDTQKPSMTLTPTSILRPELRVPVLTEPPQKCQDTLDNLFSPLHPHSQKISQGKHVRSKPIISTETQPCPMWSHSNPRLKFGLALLEALLGWGFKTLILSLHYPHPPGMASPGLRHHPVARISIGTCGMGVSTPGLVHSPRLTQARASPGITSEGKLTHRRNIDTPLKQPHSALLGVPWSYNTDFLRNNKHETCILP